MLLPLPAAVMFRLASVAPTGTPWLLLPCDVRYALRFSPPLCAAALAPLGRSGLGEVKR